MRDLRRDARRMERFARRPPRTVGELARALQIPLDALARDGDHATGLFPGRPPGPQDRLPLNETIAGVHGRYQFDLYHQRPLTTAAEIAARELVEYRVFLRRDRVRWEGALRRVYGEPPTVAGRRRYGPFFVDATDTDRMELAWHDHEPDWAKPPVDEDARAAMLRAFAGALATGTTPAARDAALAALPTIDLDLGIAVTGVAVRFDPPIPAMGLAAALGHPDAIAVTVDVHMSVWRLAVPAPPGVERLRIGAWDIDAYLAGAARGAAADGLVVGAAFVRHLADADVVRGLTLRDR